MTDTTYNGWTNYATWRLNLELFDDFDTVGYQTDTYGLSEVLKEFAETTITNDEGNNSLAIDYALVFLSDVNWHEIAARLIDDAATA